MTAKYDPPSRTWLCSKGYAIAKDGTSDALISALKEKLTVKPRINPDMPNANVESYPIYRESESWFYLPKSFGLNHFGAPHKDTLADGQDAPRLIFNGSPRPEQNEPISRFTAAQNGLLVLPCGFGKTVCALYIATVFKKKTLIICHKGFLIDQWKERIAQYIPTARVGTIKQSTVDVDGRDIVLASLQSLAMRDYPKELFQQFGFVCIDEVHHTSAEVFSRALAKVVARRILGLSATPDRKDGLRKVFEWFIGKPVFSVRKRSDNELIVRMERFYDPHPDYGREVHMCNGKRNIAQMINNVCNFAPRNELIINIITEIKNAEPERQILILSERRAHLTTLYQMIVDQDLGSCGYYVGGMSQSDLKTSESKDFILATYHIAAEGFDVPSLNTLILASPVSAIEQPIGRIQRQKPHERKFTPLVVDVWDEFSLFRNQGARRLAFYKKNGYTIQDAAAPEDATDSKKKYGFVIEDD
jgi:superfamily II DNA or RNA helicase